MYKPPRTFLPSHAKRRQATHLFREFLRGAGTGALARGRRTRFNWTVGIGVGVITALLVPQVAGIIALIGVSSVAGVLTHTGIQAGAALAHRIANKGIPEAPNHNRKAQAWGRRAVKLAAGAGFIVATGVTAGFALAASTSQPTRTPSFQQKPYPVPRLFKTTYPEQPVVLPAPRRANLTM